MIALLDCKVQWDWEAVLQERVGSTASFSWVGQQIYDGTVAGAVLLFKSLPRDRQARIEMFVDSGAFDGSGDTIFGVEALNSLASRGDLPRE